MLNRYLNKLEFNKILEILSNFSTTYIGKNLCLNLTPSSNKNDVLSSLAETSEAVSLYSKYGNPPITDFSNIEIYIKNLESATSLSSKALLDISRILKISFDLKKFYSDNLDENSENFKILGTYFSSLYTNSPIYDCINNSIIDENIIANDASKTLYSIRNKQKVLEENIKDKLNSFIHSNTYSKYLQEPIITIRNDRYVIPVKDEYKSYIKGFIHDISTSGSTVFIEPLSIFELNNEITNLKLEENIEIEKILYNLSSLLFPITNELVSNINIIGKLDFIFAKAKYSLSIDAICPTINDTNYINLISARHPLISKDLVVPISINIGDNYRTLVITGPNTGGKTVALKTVGLLTLMACSGLHIPANSGSSIFVFDNVFADIGDEQSIQESLSTFSSHISNIIEILKLSTQSSLVLLDELGSGTDPIEGSSLAISILQELYNKKLITISTTHYSEVKNYALITDGFENASSVFDIENLKPTYKLIIGIPGKSYAFAISKRLGLSEDIINNAMNLINTDNISIEELLKNIYDDKLHIENEKENIDKNSRQITSLRKSLEDKLASLNNKENEIIEKAKTEARTILLKAKDEASTAIKDINDIYNNTNSDSNKKLNNIRNSLNMSVKNLSTEVKASNINLEHLTSNDLKIGMDVLVTTIGQIGTIISLPNKSNSVQVQINNTKMNVNINNLKLVNDNNKKTHINTHIKSTTCLKSKSISSEINVIGNNVEEAIFVIDKYLDDCSLAKLNTVRIVHGKGTGILRNGIHSYLKKNPHVKSFRLGTFGEGEMGVTVVELK